MTNWKTPYYIITGLNANDCYYSYFESDSRDEIYKIWHRLLEEGHECETMVNSGLFLFEVLKGPEDNFMRIDFIKHMATARILECEFHDWTGYYYDDEYEDLGTYHTYKKLYPDMLMEIFDEDDLPVIPEWAKSVKVLERHYIRDDERIKMLDKSYTPLENEDKVTFTGLDGVTHVLVHSEYSDYGPIGEKFKSNE